MNNQHRRTWSVIIVLSSLIIMMIMVSLLLGRFLPWDAMKTLFGFGNEQQELILFQFRLPRIVMAILIGAGLAVSGALLQGTTRNAIAEPGVLGINAGAGLAIALLSLSYSSISIQLPFIMPLFAMAGGLLAGLTIYLLALRKGSVSPIRLVLVGVGVGLFCSAFILLIQIRMDPLLFISAAVWLAGSLSSASWLLVLTLLPWITILLPIAFSKSRALDVLQLGDNSAANLGVPVERERLILLVTSVMLASACVAVGGGISFVGLVAPHIARRLIGLKHRHIILASALTGSLMMLIADIGARQLTASHEMPTGIVVSAIGAPYFLYLLAKSKN
jgi:iron complex transport system permease protein